MKKLHVNLLLACFLMAIVIAPTSAFADNAGLTEKDGQPIISLPKDDKALKLDEERESELEELYELEKKVKSGEADEEKYIEKFREYAQKWHESTNVNPSIAIQNNEVQPLDVGVRKVLGVNKVGQV